MAIVSGGHGGYMKYGKTILTALFAMFLFAGALVTSSQAQTGRVTVRRISTKPVVVRRYIVRDPFWRYSYWNSPYLGYYDPYWDSPYLRYMDQKYYLQGRVQGNRRELQKHLQKYRADGYISPKEQRELQDDYNDVRKSEQRLNQFNRNY